MYLYDFIVTIYIFQMRKQSPERGRHFPKVTQQCTDLSPDPTPLPRDTWRSPYPEELFWKRKGGGGGRISICKGFN